MKTPLKPPSNLYLTIALCLCALVPLCLLSSGCANPLRFAPGEAQKQNAYLHHRTVVTAAAQAMTEGASGKLQGLTKSAARQSDAIVAYYGMPGELPPAETADELLSVENQAVTESASIEAVQRPDPWDIADHLLELGIGLAGIAGGVFGTRAARTLVVARRKSRALKEVVLGNELFKQRQTQMGRTEVLDEFGQAHNAKQSETTTQLIAHQRFPLKPKPSLIEVAPIPPAPTGKPDTVGP